VRRPDQIQLAEGVATLEQIRAVWASVTRRPTITARQISTETGIKRTKVHHILQFLQAAGYIRHKAHQTGRVVVIPFIEVTHVNPARSRSRSGADRRGRVPGQSAPVNKS
jgi:biotin operon repressor